MPEGERLKVTRIVEMGDEAAQQEEVNGLTAEERDLFVIFLVIRDLQAR